MVERRCKLSGYKQFHAFLQKLHQSGIPVELRAFGHADRGPDFNTTFRNNFAGYDLAEEFKLAKRPDAKEPVLFSDKRQKHDPLRPDGSGFNLG